MRTGAVFACIVLFASIAPPARANPAAAWAAEFIGEYFLGKTLDEVFDAATGQPDLRALDSRLLTYEAALARVDAQLAIQVTQLRRELSTKVSREDVERIVNQTLAKLADKISDLETRSEKIEVRIKEFEEAFGFLPTMPPSPLLRTTLAEGAPTAHPLTVEWAKLLTRCESSRLHIENMRRELTDQNEDLIAARRADAQILQEITDLHGKVNKEVAKLADGRAPLLKRYKPTHRDVRLHDDNIASMLWLLGVSKPVPAGVLAGRLEIPSDLVGPACSDILAAFELANADVAALVPLFRQLLVVEIKPAYPQADLPLGKRLEELVERTDALVQTGREQSGIANQTQRDLKAALVEYSNLHPTVIGLRKKRTEQLALVRGLHELGEKQLAEALREYVELLKTNRPTNSRMTAFRNQALLPLKEVCDVSDCADWSNRLELDAAWDRFLKYNPNSIGGESNAKAGHERSDNVLNMKFAWCPPGEFAMGTREGDSDGSDDEAQVKVKLSRGFWLGKYEVTQEQWQRIMGTTPWKGDRYVREGNDYPASLLSARDADEFCRTFTSTERRAGRLSDTEEYILPTEAQWEYACRAGTNTTYFFGERFIIVDSSGIDQLGEYAWLDASTIVGNSKSERDNSGPHPIGQKRPNPWGLHDTYGNVSEWCRDTYMEELPGGIDPLVTNGSARCHRGGWWSVGDQWVRSANRDSSLEPSNAFGFRVARIHTPK